MTQREQAEGWILAQCPKDGSRVSGHFEKTSLPPGIDENDIKSALGELRRAGRVAGNIMTIADNTKLFIRGLARGAER